MNQKTHSISTLRMTFSEVHHFRLIVISGVYWSPSPFHQNLTLISLSDSHITVSEYTLALLILSIHQQISCYLCQSCILILVQTPSTTTHDSNLSKSQVLTSYHYALRFKLCRSHSTIIDSTSHRSLNWGIQSLGLVD